jgi:hypothetical protein
MRKFDRYGHPSDRGEISSGGSPFQEAPRIIFLAFEKEKKTGSNFQRLCFLLFIKEFIGAGLPDFSRRNIPKLGKMYQIATKSPNGHKMYLMALLYSKWPKNMPTFFHYKVLENLPKFGFLV